MVANCRIAIEQARLLTLKAAWMMDTVGAKGAMSEISQIKVVAPSVAQMVIDHAIQIHGGAGVSPHLPLAGLFASARTLRTCRRSGRGASRPRRQVGTEALCDQAWAYPAKDAKPPGAGKRGMSGAELLDKAGAVRRGEEIDLAKIDAFLKAIDPLLAGALEITQFPGGASNLTYLLRYPGRELVLRRPPFGHRAKGAHDMLREARVMTALKPAYPYVPTVVATCDSPDVMDCSFYVMERIPGIIPRRDLPQGLNLGEADIGRLCRNVIDKLVELHQVDFKAAGLEALGKGEGYVRRQIEGWSDRCRKARVGARATSKR